MSSTVSATTSSSKRRTASTATKKLRDVIYPFFYEASNFIQDDFWKNFFIDMSKGKLGRKIYIDDKYVSHNGKKTSFNYCYEGKTPEQTATELKKMISDTLCIYSEADMTFEKGELDELASEFKLAKSEDDFKKVKNNKMKDHLIVNYVVAQREKHKLSWSQARFAYRVINNALKNFRTHKNDDFTMVNGEIVSIDDIVITNGSILNKRYPLLELETKKPTVKKVNLDKEWGKWCNDYYKQCKLLLCLDHDTDAPLKKKRRATVASTEVKKTARKRTASSKALETSTPLEEEEVNDDLEPLDQDELLDELEEYSKDFSKAYTAQEGDIEEDEDLSDDEKPCFRDCNNDEDEEDLVDDANDDTFE